MEEPKKKKNEPEVEINWDVIERQYGEITARPIPDVNKQQHSEIMAGLIPDELYPQKPEDLPLWLGIELVFGIDELKANSAGKLTLRQRQRLAQPFAYKSTMNFSYMVLIVLGIVMTTVLGVQICSYLLLALLTLMISRWFIIRGRQILHLRSSVQYRKAYLVACPHIDGCMLVASDEPYYRPSSWEITAPVSERLYNAFKESTHLYHIYYTSTTKTILSVERAE